MLNIKKDLIPIKIQGLGKVINSNRIKPLFNYILFMCIKVMLDYIWVDI